MELNIKIIFSWLVGRSWEKKCNCEEGGKERKYIFGMIYKDYSLYSLRNGLFIEDSIRIIFHKLAQSIHVAKVVQTKHVVYRCFEVIFSKLIYLIYLYNYNVIH